jgi:membrane-associated phospholipid phosphatase
MTILWPFEIPIILWIQNLGSWLTEPMRIFTFLGTEEFFLLFLSALYWCIDSTIGLRVAFSLLISNSVNSSLKLAFRGARPYWLSSGIQSVVHETSFGIPSGHAQNSMVVWGTIALGFRKKWVTIVCCLLIFLVGFSRIFLGVHWISDVVAGWMIGLILLWVIAKLERPVVRWWIERSFFLQILLSLLICLLVILTGFFWQTQFITWNTPALWLENIAIHFPGASIIPVSLADNFSLAGLWLGMLIGASWLHRLHGHIPPTNFGKKVLVYIIGLLGVLIFWRGLGIIFPQSEDWIGYGFRTFRYALVGFWIIALAPLLFRKLNLSAKL